MQRSYWEKIAPSYEEEIFDVLHNDKKRFISSAIKKKSSKNKTVIDLGCAVGKWLPVLSPLFKKVYAVDISEKNLQIAKRKYAQLSNIEYIRADLSGKKTKLPACNVAICINAILTSSLKDRNSFFKTLSNCIAKDGSLILVIPSLESYLLTSIISNQWEIDKEILNKKISAAEAKQKWENMKQGNADIDNVPTKHYLKEELILLLSQQKFDIEKIQKIEYDWKTEFISTPKWLKEPFPWDWLVIAKKK